jgi:CubicO group peptidase (beta-lactamase class C family)
MFLKLKYFLIVALFLLFACSKEETPNEFSLPEITTNLATSITNTQANIDGIITKNGNSAILNYGICWNISPNPTIENTKTSNTANVTTFENTLQDLLPNTLYYARAYATNQSGTVYGNEVSFTTLMISPNELMYFPPNDSNSWEIKSLQNLGWNAAAVSPLLEYLQLKNTKSFIILVNGRIVLENYFNGHTADSPWYWASAGKTLTATTTGIAEQEGLLNTNNKVSDYLGTGWTSTTLQKENLITCKNLLTMTSGLDDTTGDGVSAANLIYKADAGTRWAYHNVYVKLQDVVAAASNSTWINYFNLKLKNPIGMNGTWIPNNDLSVYWSNSRSMARFGLLALNKGKWKETQIVNQNYFELATTTSQNLNLGYGYLWWLNGKSSYRLPQTQIQFNGSILPNGSNDMFMALGKNDQKIYVVPSKKMVVIRMGEAADTDTFGLSDFDNQLWLKINALYQ